MHNKNIFFKWYSVFFVLQAAHVIASDSVAGGGASNGQNQLLQMIEGFEAFGRQQIEDSFLEQRALLKQSKELRGLLSVAQVVHSRELSDTMVHYEHSINQLTRELGAAESAGADARAELGRVQSELASLLASSKSNQQQLSAGLDQTRELEAARLNAEQFSQELEQMRQALHQARQNATNSQNTSGASLVAATLGGAGLGAAASFGIKKGCIHQ